MSGAAQTGHRPRDFPLKDYTIMAAGRPVVVSADPDSELAWVVSESSCGWAVPPDDPQALAASIEAAYSSREEMARRGKRGRDYVISHYSRRAAARQYDELIRRIVRSA